MSLLFLCTFAFLAGFVDSIAGGGGLIQLPAVFLALPNVIPGATGVMALGTNKFSSVFGTALATYRYVRRVKVAWRVVGLCTVAAAAFSYLGASVVGLIPEPVLRAGVAALLVAVGAYTYLKPNFGVAAEGTPRTRGAWALAAALGLGAGIGFYDGFFGPGTGTFLIFAFVGGFRLNFLEASAAAKIVNLVTNLFALVFFVAHGHVAYEVGIPMAVCNMVGSYAGTHVALKRGAKAVRVFFLVVVAALALKLGLGL